MAYLKKGRMGTYFVSATGPDDAVGVEYGDYKVHTFTATKTGSEGFVVANTGVAPYNIVEYLVLAGGGGGGTWRGGGGGAGGYRTNMVGEASGGVNAAHETAMTCPAAGNHDVTVGAGAAGASGGNGNTGGNSVFNGITSTGGGAGAGLSSNSGGSSAGGNGGSGGGGMVGTTSSTQTGGAANGTAQGNVGGACDAANGGAYSGAGGGGAGQPGVSTKGRSDTREQTGGDGLHSHISGSLVWRGGGGAGFKYGSGNNAGGRGGGGHGPILSDSAVGAHMHGDDQFGGGGGGAAGYQNGGDGGDGIVIIRYQFQDSGRV